MGIVVEAPVVRFIAPAYFTTSHRQAGGKENEGLRSSTEDIRYGARGK